MKPSKVGKHVDNICSIKKYKSYIKNIYGYTSSFFNLAYLKI
jgi:hypothetical protein